MFVLLGVILLFKIVPSYSAEVLSSVPKPKKVVTCLKKKLFVLDELCSGVELLAMSSVSMNQYMLNRMSFKKNTHKTGLCIEKLMKILQPEACRNLTLHFS